MAFSVGGANQVRARYMPLQEGVPANPARVRTPGQHRVWRNRPRAGRTRGRETTCRRIPVKLTGDRGSCRRRGRVLPRLPGFPRALRSARRGGASAPYVRGTRRTPRAAAPHILPACPSNPGPCPAPTEPPSLASGTCLSSGLTRITDTDLWPGIHPLSCVRGGTCAGRAANSARHRQDLPVRARRTAG
jgi:hypothetical protein